MPSAKAGTAGSPVAPADPTVALDADDADPGAVESTKAEQRATLTGKYGTEQSTPFKPDDPDAATTDGSATTATTSWIEIVLVDEEGQPVPGESYEITLPDTTVASGTLDEKGFARVEGFQPGQCQITFPNLDQDAWEAK